MVSESFDGADDGIIPQTGVNATVSADSITGSGTITHSQTWSLDGGGSLGIAGTASHYLRWVHPSTAAHRAQFYYKHDDLPGETAYVYYLYAGNATTVALRIGVTALGEVYLQDSTTGTGAADDLSAALTVGSYYRFDLTANASTATLSIFDINTINNTTTATDWATLTCTLTATTFSDEALGLINTLASGGTVVTGNLVNEGFVAQ